MHYGIGWTCLRAMVPEHLWKGRSEEEVSSGINENPVGTGPYLYESHSQDRMVWVKNDNWWAKDALGLDVKPMDDAAFRKAVAIAIDVNEIVEIVYGNIVKATDPTGLLPAWSEFIDEKVVDKLGFSYNPGKQKVFSPKQDIKILTETEYCF